VTGQSVVDVNAYQSGFTLLTFISGSTFQKGFFCHLFLTLTPLSSFLFLPIPWPSNACILCHSQYLYLIGRHSTNRRNLVCLRKTFQKRLFQQGKNIILTLNLNFFRHFTRFVDSFFPTKTI